MTKLKFGTFLGLGTWLVASAAWADVGSDMNAEGDADVGAQMSAEGSGESQADSGAETSGATAGGDAGGDTGGGAATIDGDKFAAPYGAVGAGLSLSPAQKGRFFGELGLHTQDNFTVMAPVLGFGYKVIDVLELEIALPLAFVSYDVGLEDESAFKVGNPYVGVNYLGGSGQLRYKLGGGLALPLADADDFGGIFAIGGASAIRGYQEPHYWAWQTFSMVGLGRVEYGDELVFGGDFSLGIGVPVGDNDGDTEVSLTLAPGVGYYLNEENLIGGRLPISWGVTGDGDNAQIALEPYYRHDFGSDGFFNARFTLNLDEPSGFAFDDGGVWGLHAGGGLMF